MVRFILKPTHKRVAGKTKKVLFQESEESVNVDGDRILESEYDYDAKYDAKRDPDRWISGYRGTRIRY
jgi:hypothetical protein